MTTPAFAPVRPDAVERQFVTLGERQLHLRRAGSGPAAVLLAPLPYSSAVLAPLVEQLAPRFTALAPDLPGYGLSAAPLVDSPSSGDYTAEILALLDALAVERFAVYGEQFGALLAVELARRAGSRVTSVVVRDLPVLDAAERSRLEAAYTQPIVPRLDGGHLLEHWRRRRDEHVFFPFDETRAECRLGFDLQRPGILERRVHQGVFDELTATPGSGPGYAALFGADPLGVLAADGHELVVVSTPDDLLPPARDRLVPTAAGSMRFVASDDLGACLIDELVPAPTSPPPAAAPDPIDGRLWKTYARTGSGALLVRRRSGGSGRPLVLFHSSPGSGKKLEPLLATLAPGRPLYALDALGNGDSDKPQFLRSPGLTDYAEVVEQALDDLGLGEVDLYGTHTGALVALEVALRLGPRARRVILEGITLFDPEENAAFLAHHFIDLSPRFDGSHLIVAWGHVRDAHLWFPWFDRRPDRLAPFPHPSAETLHAYLLELLRSGPTYQGSYRAVFEHRTAERLPLLRSRTLVCHAPTDPLGRFSERAAGLAGAETLLLPSADPADAAPLFARFLDSDGD